MAKDNKNDSYNFEDEVLSPNFSCVDFYQKRKKGKYRLTFAPDTQFAVADTHCHLEMFKNPEWPILRCALHNVSFLACVIDSTDDGPEAFDKVEHAFEKAQKMLPKIVEDIKNYGKQADEPLTIKASDGSPKLCCNTDAIVENPQMPKIKYIVGTHPHHSKDFDAQNLCEMLKHKDVTCVGEIGLDYHYDLSPRDVQRKIFAEQLMIAREAKLPVALHLREAHDDALKIFDELGFDDEAGTLLHCFNLGKAELKPWVDAGCYVAFGGPLTFKNSDETREAVSMVPSDKLLTETDAPFMTPEPLRGDTCFPDHVIFTADKLAEVTGNNKNKHTFYSQIYQNALDLLDR